MKAIIFDFDGVILDSVNVKTKAFELLYEEYGPEIQKKVVEMKDTVNRTSSPLLEVKGLTTRFLIKQILEEQVEIFMQLKI